jgi:hypothetical protein
LNRPDKSNRGGRPYCRAETGGFRQPPLGIYFGLFPLKETPEHLRSLVDLQSLRQAHVMLRIARRQLNDTPISLLSLLREFDGNNLRGPE